MKLEAGVELDALIATRVMGCKRGSANWSPSTDIADAWEVVEKVGATLNFQLDNVGFEPDVWRALFGWGDDPISAAAEAPTAPMAICLAALKLAIGVER